jgi:hypothetical protein
MNDAMGLVATDAWNTTPRTNTADSKIFYRVRHCAILSRWLDTVSCTPAALRYSDQDHSAVAIEIRLVHEPNAIELHASRKLLDWSRQLPRPLTIPGTMTLASLADMRALIEKHLPKECRERST